MAKKTSLTIGEYKFTTEAGKAELDIEFVSPLDPDAVKLTLDDLGDLSEFIATAWENLSGEEYGQGFVPHLLRASGSLERDCE